MLPSSHSCLQDKVFYTDAHAMLCFLCIDKISSFTKSLFFLRGIESDWKCIPSACSTTIFSWQSSAVVWLYLRKNCAEDDLRLHTIGCLLDVARAAPSVLAIVFLTLSLAQLVASGAVRLRGRS